MVNQDGTYSILARICDLTGSGQIVEPLEGPCIKQADVSVISCEILDLGSNRDNPSGSQVTPNPTMTAAANIFDTLQTNGMANERRPQRIQLQARHRGPIYSNRRQLVSV
jgi:hypothetical protein